MVSGHIGRSCCGLSKAESFNNVHVQDTGAQMSQVTHSDDIVTNIDHFHSFTMRDTFLLDLITNLFLCNVPKNKQLGMQKQSTEPP